MQQTSSQKGLKFSDILITVVIALVFGVIFKLWDHVNSASKVLFPQSGQLTYGMWFMAGPFAYMLLRKPGVAFLASFAAAVVSMLLGSTWSFEVVLYGFVQGLAAELVFLLLGYRKFGVIAAGVAGIMSAIASLCVDLPFGYADYEPWIFILKYTLRFISAFVFCGLFAYGLVRALEATGVTKSIRPLSREDYAALDK